MFVLRVSHKLCVIGDDEVKESGCVYVEGRRRVLISACLCCVSQLEGR